MSWFLSKRLSCEVPWGKAVLKKKRVNDWKNRKNYFWKKHASGPNKTKYQIFVKPPANKASCKKYLTSDWAMPSFIKGMTKEIALPSYKSLKNAKKETEIILKNKLFCSSVSTI